VNAKGKKSSRGLLDRDLTYFVFYAILAHIFFYKFFVPGQMVFGTDTLNQSYPIQVMGMREIFENRAVPLWNPYIMSGMPLLASFSFHIFYPLSWIYFFMSTEFAMGYQYVLHFTLMGIFFFCFARQLGLSRQASFVGGLLFMFNAHLISLVYPGHGGKIFTMTWLPIALLFLDRALKGRMLYNMAIMGLMVGLMFYAGHIQIMFYCGIALLLFLLYNLAADFRKKGLSWAAKSAAGFVLAFALGALLYSVILFPAWEYKGYTHRAGGITGASSYEFATSFSQPPEDMLYLALRDPFGWGKDYGPTTPNTSDIFYRGRIGLRLSVDYFSVIGILLALIGIIFVRNRYTWFFLGLALLSMFLAMGGFNPLYPLIYKYVPGFSIFRVPYAIMIMIPICGAVMAAFGTEYLVQGRGRAGKGFMVLIYVGAAIAACVFAAAYLIGRNVGATGEWLIGFDLVRQMLWGEFADLSERVLFFGRNLYFFALMLTLSVAILFVYRKGLLKVKYIALILSVMVLAELWPVGWDFIKTIPVSSLSESYFKVTPQIETLKADKEPFRVFSLVTNNELLYQGIQSMTGYHAVPLSYYEKALDRVTLDGPLLTLLDAKYLMLPKELQYDFRAIPDEGMRKALLDRFELISDSDMFFYRNKGALRRAWLVSSVSTLGDDEQALDIVPAPGFNPFAGALVAEEVKSPPAPADLSAQRVDVMDYRPDKVEFKVSAPADAFMVASEIWYPGWNAYVDGVKTKIYRTDYLLRGLMVPKGEHTVVMSFEPLYFRLGAAVTLVTLLALMAAILSPLYLKGVSKKSR